MLDAVLQSLTPCAAARFARPAYLARLLVAAIGLVAGALLVKHAMPDAYVAWVTIRDIQVTLVAGLTDWLELALAVALLFWAAALLWHATLGRLHDLGYHGIAALFLLIPGVNLLLLIFLALLKGSERPNRFGKPQGRPNAAPRCEAGAKPKAAVALPVGDLSAEAPNQEESAAPKCEPESPALRALWARYRADVVDENLSVRLQLKNRFLTKLEALYKKGDVTPLEYERFKRAALRDEE